MDDAIATITTAMNKSHLCSDETKPAKKFTTAAQRLYFTTFNLMIEPEKTINFLVDMPKSC